MKLTLRYLIFVDASLWSWRYATWSSLTLHHEVDATLLDLRWHFTMNLTLRYLIFVDTSLHVDGLSSLYVHSNLGLECVLDAYASYMQKMLDQLNPNKMFQNVDWLKPPALWEQKWKSSPTRTPGRVARRTQFFEKLNPKKSTIKMLVAEVKPCNHVVAWHIHLVKIHTSLQRKRNFEENNRLKEHDFSYQQRCMSSWMQLELGQTPPVNPICCFHFLFVFIIIFTYVHLFSICSFLCQFRFLRVYHSLTSFDRLVYDGPRIRFVSRPTWFKFCGWRRPSTAVKYVFVPLFSHMCFPVMPILAMSVMAFHLQPTSRVTLSTGWPRDSPPKGWSEVVWARRIPCPGGTKDQFHHFTILRFAQMLKHMSPLLFRVKLPIVNGVESWNIRNESGKKMRRTKTKTLKPMNLTSVRRTKTEFPARLTAQSKTVRGRIHWLHLPGGDRPRVKQRQVHDLRWRFGSWWINVNITCVKMQFASKQHELPYNILTHFVVLLLFSHSQFVMQPTACISAWCSTDPHVTGSRLLLVLGPVKFEVQRGMSK